MMCVRQVNGREAALSLSSSVEDGKSPTDAALWNEAKKVTALLGEQVSIFFISIPIDA